MVFSSRRGRDGRKTNSSGVARSRRVKGAFPYGSVITIRAVKKGFVGVYLKEKVTKGGLKTLKKACIAAMGKHKPAKCSRKLVGS